MTQASSAAPNSGRRAPAGQQADQEAGDLPPVAQEEERGEQHQEQPGEDLGRAVPAVDSAPVVSVSRWVENQV